MPPAKEKHSATGLPAGLLAAGFVALALAPLLAARLSGLEAVAPLHEFGTALGLTAGALILLQFLSSGRYESLSGRVGLDRTMGFHRIASYGLMLFALLHPLGYVAATFVTDPSAAWSRLTGMMASPRLQTGVVALAGLILLVVLGTLRDRIGWRYETWRASHGLMASAVAALVLHHAFTTGAYSLERLVYYCWIAGAGVAAVALLNVYAVRPWRMWRAGWQVESVTRLAARTWGMTLICSDPGRFDFRGGQFIWLTLAPNRPPFHDHPFSIASAPAELPRLRLIVREAGDCTNRFGETKPGTRAAVDGPHGSFFLHGADKRVIMIAGGVGIAPLIGMLEEAASEGDGRSFQLLYAAQSPDEVAGIERLKELQVQLDLSVRYLVDKGARAPVFLQGPVRPEHLKEALGPSPRDTMAYVCGPPGMMENVADRLLALGVPASAIHYERFDFGAGKGRIDRQRRWQAIGLLMALVAGMALFSLG
jgi:predicted ferric reductase